MKIESSITARQFRFYDETGKYVGVVNVQIRGPRVILDSLVSREFYSNFDRIWSFINETCGSHIWHAHVEPAHLRLIQRKLSSRYDIKVLKTEEHAGRTMCWIEVEAR